MKAATCEYIAFLDADDHWLPHFMERKFKVFKGLSESFFGVYGSFIYSNTGRSGGFCEFVGAPPAELIDAEGGFPGGVPSYLFRRAAIVEVGGFDEMLKVNEDFDLVLRLLRRGYLLKGKNIPDFVRNMRPGSLTRNKGHRLLYERVENFLEKAHEEAYFKSAHLEWRKKLNRLVLAKALLLELGCKREAYAALKSAFSLGKPHGWKEVGAYVCFLILSVLYGGSVE